MKDNIHIKHQQQKQQTTKNTMERTEIENIIRAIIVEKLLCESEEVKLESSFINDLGADSLDNVELIVEFEKKFNVNITDDEAEAIKTVEDAVDYMYKNSI